MQEGGAAGWARQPQPSHRRGDPLRKPGQPGAGGWVRAAAGRRRDPLAEQRRQERDAGIESASAGNSSQAEATE
ncbi:hypothetical protein GCM10025792_13580 [Pseudonocardia tropica]